MKTNKEIVVSFLNNISSGNIEEAYHTCIADEFIHHNAYFASDAASLRRGMEENQKMFPHKTLEILHALEEGDLVATHSRLHLTPGDLGVAVVHLCRLKNGRIVEMWDVGQPVPEHSPNEQGML